MTKPIRSICVFCGSSSGSKREYLEAAEALGSLLGRSQIELVYGGASVGLMGAMANAALAAGGRVTGIIPKALDSREVAHRGLSKLEIVDTMLERKARMTELADGFVALPGGGGTLDELFEVFTWAQLGMHTKPIVLYQVAGFYDHLIEFVDHAVTQGFISAEHRRILKVADGAESVLAAVRAGGVETSAQFIDQSDL